MKILVTYDINVTEDGGEKRLRRIAKVCLNYGQRVQNSVFECEVTQAQAKLLETELLKEIDLDKDSVRIYLLTKDSSKNTIHHGVKPSYDLKKPIVL